MFGMVTAGISLAGEIAMLQIGGAISSVIAIGINYMLWHGIKTRKPAFVLAYFVIVTIQTVLLGIASALAAIFLAILDDQTLGQYLGMTEADAHAFHTTMCGFVGLVIVIALPLQIYLNAVVYSFYKELQEEQLGQGGQLGFTAMEAGGFGDKKGAPPPY